MTRGGERSSSFSSRFFLMASEVVSRACRCERRESRAHDLKIALLSVLVALHGVLGCAGAQSVDDIDSLSNDPEATPDGGVEPPPEHPPILCYEPLNPRRGKDRRELES